jgi:hypothetical protein
MKEKKYQLMGTTKKATALFALLLFSLVLHAQNDSPADSILWPADSMTVIEAVPDVEKNAEEDEDEETETNYFLPRALPGSVLDSPYFRKAGDSIRAAMQGDEDFWYANTIFRKRKEETGKRRSFSDSGLFQFILWLFIIGGFVSFLIIYLSNSNASLFRKSRLISQEEDDPGTDNIFAINYQKEIDKAISNGNYRLGVRLLFLQLLRGLSEKNIIQYTHDRTNFDYLLQVQQASWFQLFFRLTRNYEYVWYGHFEIDNQKFDTIKKDFTDLERQLPQS